MNGTPEKQTPGGNRASANETSKPRQFSANSPNSAAQRQRIVEALRRRPQTTEDLRKLGIFQAPARVKELRDQFGYRIQTARVTVVDREGYPHPRAALYSLISEPPGA